jgi:hypothetical protein
MSIPQYPKSFLYLGQNLTKLGNIPRPLISRLKNSNNHHFFIIKYLKDFLFSEYFVMAKEIQVAGLVKALGKLETIFIWRMFVHFWTQNLCLFENR